MSAIQINIEATVDSEDVIAFETATIDALMAMVEHVQQQGIESETDQVDGADWSFTVSYED